MNHTQKGQPKIVEELTLPATSLRPVTLIVTEMAVIEPTEKGLVLRETAPGMTVETICEATGTRLIVPSDVTVMSVGIQVSG
jgi:acetate CoA/acetoacetate CoA-transferase beta subunit